MSPQTVLLRTTPTRTIIIYRPMIWLLGLTLYSQGCSDAKIPLFSKSSLNWHRLIVNELGFVNVCPQTYVSPNDILHFITCSGRDPTEDKMSKISIDPKFELRYLQSKISSWSWGSWPHLCAMSQPYTIYFSLLAEAPFPLYSLSWRAGRKGTSAMGRNSLWFNRRPWSWTAVSETHAPCIVCWPWLEPTVSRAFLYSYSAVI